MIQLELVPRTTAPVAAAIAEAFPGTSLRVQPAPGSGAGSAPSPAFAGISKPTADVQAVRAGLRPPFETALVDLSVARSIALGNALILPIVGTAYFIDKGTDVGQATIHLQDQSNNPVNTLNVFPGDANNNIPFTFWMIENAAQAGKVLRIAYGTDIIFQPGLGGNVTFTGGVAILQTAAGAPQGNDLTASNDRVYVKRGSQAAVAAQFSGFAVENLAASGKRVYVDGVQYKPGAAAEGIVTVGATGGLPQITAFNGWLNGQLAHSTSHAELGTAAAVVGAVTYRVFAGLTPNQWENYDFPIGIPLDPGFACYVWCNVVNTQADFVIRIREY